MLKCSQSLTLMKLDYKSSQPKAKNTPIGRYRWFKLPFLNQISCRDVSKDHEYAIMDDTFITGHNAAHHDSVLEIVPQQERNAGNRAQYRAIQRAHFGQNDCPSGRP